MSREQPLLDVAAALADGTDVDWEAARRALANDDERRLLEGLRFIAGLSQRAPGATWGPLQILEHVGRGTFGDVYRAWDPRLDREVALKLLHRTEREDPSRASTVIQEGRLLARVRHPNVATVYGAERIGNEIGVWMEFVHGRTLEQQLRDHGPASADRIVKIGVDLAGALSSVHRAGLIHRDVKAQNVLCDRDGRLVLTDFGATCEQHDASEGDQSGAVGTPICTAPELLAGRAATPESDVYSLGVLLYHVATGAYPVSGESVAVLREAHASGRRTPLADVRPDLPPPLNDIVDRAVDPDPRRRFGTPEDMRAALAALAGSTTVDAVRAATLPRERWRRWVALAAAAVIAIGAWQVIRSMMSAPAATLLNAEVEFAEIVALTEHGRLEDAYARALQARAAAPRSPAAASGAAYALTYAGFLDEAARAVDDAITFRPEFLKENAWWTPTVFLYRREHDRFLAVIQDAAAPAPRLYRALAELERNGHPTAVEHLRDAERSATHTFSNLAVALREALAGNRASAVALLTSIADDRRAAGDRDGEVTFKMAQIHAVADDAARALDTLGEAVTQGFVCVSCFESSVLLTPVRALEGFSRVTERAALRRQQFGRRFGLPGG